MGKNKYEIALKKALEYKAIYDELIEKYSNKAQHDLTHRFRSVITKWYSSYDKKRGGEPHIYHRKDSLYHAFKITVNNGNVIVNFNSNFMDEQGYQHRASNEYIFENSFISGYHGGAIKGANHPNPGTPYWKQWGDFSSWGRPAIKTNSPYNLIVEQYEKGMIHLDKLFMNEFDKKVYLPLMKIISEIS